MWSQGPLSGWGPTLVFPQAQPEPTELQSRDAEGKTEVPFFFSGQMSPGLSLTDISVWVSPDLVQTWRLPFHLCALLAVPSSPSPLLSIGAAPSCPLFLATHSTFPCCFSPFILSILTALAPDLISHLDNFRILLPPTAATASLTRTPERRGMVGVYLSSLCKPTLL